MLKRSIFSSLIFMTLMLSSFSCAQRADQHSFSHHFVFIIPSYNNIKWYKNNLHSIFEQEKTYTNWRVIYIDDCSKDGTGSAVLNYVKECGFEHKVTVQHNEINRGALANIYYAVHSCQDDEIVVLVDGDDWLNQRCPVLKILNDAYQDENVWMTYGQYTEYPSKVLGLCAKLPWEVIEWNAHRKYRWVTSHLRTFYAGLFKRINKEDLLYEDDFYPMTWDLAIMFPMLEMAGHHIKFITDILYIYNLDNPLNDWRKDYRLVVKLHNLIRQQQPYEPLKELDLKKK